ncbi:MAG: hypothetical protein J6Y94_01425, partial [Bacteriovoracaceae bacterium]|nr:hypothetical protein [Bacteriovoracaceae bacterium]
GITVMSAIMGRQVLYALLVVVAGQLIGYGWRHRSALAPLWQRGKLLGRKSFWQEWVSSLRKRKFWPVWPTLAAWGKACGQKIWQDPFQQWVIWGLMLGIVLLPHLCYIFLYPDANYFRREQDLMREFFTQPHLWWWRIGPTLNMLFMPMIGRTFFSRYTLDEALLPFWMWPLWLVGLLGLWRRRRYLLLALNFVPAIGAYVSGPYDFRFFFAVPAWMITMGTGLGILAQAPWIARWWRGSTWLAKFKFGLMLALILMVMFGLCYWGNYSWHFYHDEVYQALGIWGACLFFFAIIWWGMRHYHQAAQPVQAARYYFWQGLGIVGSWIILGAGLTAAAWRLSSLAERPHAFFTLPHHDVGRARMMQDVLRGRSFVQASYHDKDELRPKQRLGPPDTYVGVCSAAYGIVHLFLPRDKTQKFFDFCPGPINVVRWEQVQEQNRKFWLQLSPSTADRYLFLWDFTKAHAPLYSNLRAMRPPGELKLLSSEVDGEEVRIFYLVQTADQFREWQRRLAQDRPPHHGLEIMPTSGDKRRKTF